MDLTTFDTFPPHKEEEEKASSILESITDGFITLDSEWRYIYVNAEAERLNGLSREEHLGKVAWDLFPGVAGTQLEERLRRAVAEGKPVEFENYYGPWDRWFRLKAYPLREGGLSIYFRDITPERKAEAVRQRAEEALRESEARLNAIIGQATAGIAEGDLTGRFTLVNDRYCAMVGRTREEMLGLNVGDITHPDDLSLTQEMLRHAIAHERPYTIEKRYLRPDGSIIWTNNSVNLIVGADGKPSRLVIVSVDITERKQAQLRHAFLTQLDDATRPLTSSAEVTQIAARLLGEYLSVNRCAYADVESDENTAVVRGSYNRDVPSITGRYKLSEFGREFARCMQEARPYVVEDAELDPRVSRVREAYRSAQIRAALCVSLLKDGRVAAGLALHQKTPRRWTGEEIELVRVVASRCWESIERARAERELQTSEERFRTMTEALPQLVWTCNPEGDCDYLSRQWIAYTGLTEEKTIGYRWIDAVLHPEDRARTREAWMQALEGQADYDIEYRMRRHDGVYRWFKARATPFRNGRGEIVKWFGTSTDIDRQICTERELRRANQDLEQFAFSASHDLQEPLRMVSIFSQMLKRKYAGQLDEEADEFIQYITRGATQMEMLLKDLLTYSQAANSISDEREEFTSGDAVMAKVRHALAAAIEQSGAVIHADALPTVKLKEVYLFQLLQNLIGNAIKYRSTETPQIYVTAVREDRQWRFSVRDNGIGIDPRHQQLVFGIFKRLHGQKYEGTGIGLAICQRIAERYGGRIWVESQLGQGATFHVTLPASERDS
jgi:PAS domain S-box-containing protein